MRLEILIALVVLLAVASGAALFLSWKEDPLRPVDLDVLGTLFAPRSHDFTQLSGGLLVHTMTIADVTRLLDVEDFVLEANDSAITDCSFPDADLTGSCSAWTYLRSDLMPMIFNTPTQVNSSQRGDWDDAGKTYSTPVIGIIVNPALVWPLISSMGVVDSSTNERNCGQFYFSDSRNVKVKCTEADGGVGHDTVVDFHGPLRSSDICQKDCDENDAYCKYQNAGGSIALSVLGNNGLGNWGCQDCSGPFPEDGVRGVMAGCSQSSLPYLCSLDDGTRPEDGIVDPKAWAPYGKSNGYARAHVGPGGERLQNLFETSEGLTDTWVIGGNQCKFRRDDWGAWVEAIKRYYRTVWKHYDPETRSLKADQDAVRGKNYLMSCPRYVFSFFDNEVNLYLNPKSNEKKYQDLAAHQSRVLRNAIVGFFSVGKTCKQQLASLEGSTCSYEGATYTGAEDRCLAWFCGKDATPDCRENFLREEEVYLRKAEGLAKKLTQKFNSKYRSGGNKKPAGFFKYVGSNSSFVDVKYLERLMKGKAIPLQEVFVGA